LVSKNNNLAILVGEKMEKMCKFKKKLNNKNIARKL
jgi:hypothetical protein